MAPLLEARHVTKTFSGGMFDRSHTVAVDDFSLVLQDSPPSITAIVGESGSGKTTLARLLLGIAEPTSGEILYNGRDVTKLSAAERRTFIREVQVIFQDPYEVYNPFYTVDHVLELPIKKFGLASTRAAGRALMEETLSAVGLRPEETLGRFPHQLSGGQRQRIMVARALLLKPRVIIADEPVSMVDASLRATILNSLRQLNQQFGISLIYITHDLTTAYQISENIIVLYRGGVAEVGSVERVVQQPRHPYTQLLVGSVPLPDPEHHWEAEPAPSLIGTKMTAASCRFANRCPSAMDQCLQARPPLYQLNPDRAASCYLYADAPVMATGGVDRVFASAEAAD